eukprot:m.191428 g.191428  ORF g.191428 m.191428 type:complete len:1029 (-) comp32433_c0_seq2:101-3187(-)
MLIHTLRVQVFVRLGLHKRSPREIQARFLTPLLRTMATPSQTRARVTTHFLPKFENASEGHRLERPTMIEGHSQVLAVSKKHSGSLVMAPPFFAKNSTANMFSRTPALILKAHFDACWGSESATMFAQWWQDAEERGLTYSFECVVPRVLGDHGATPHAAYNVLTAVSAGNDFVSPTALLQLAIKWRLPLNEIWFVPWSMAETVQNELHKHRWTAYDSDIDELIQTFEQKVDNQEGAVLQRFLKHTDTQGAILEGFVLMSLDLEDSADGDLSLMTLAHEYSTSMAKYHDKALESVLDMGRKCMARDADLLNTLSKPIADCPEPQTARVGDGRELEDARWWRLALADHGDKRLQRLFEILHRNYLPYVSLKPYNYGPVEYDNGGSMMIQVKISSDDVFYAWKLHMAQGAAPLFRGMVVTFSAKPLPPLIPMEMTSGSSKIIEIGKLKCLHYIIRTFAIRNRMRNLLDDAPDVYANSVQRAFCRNWSVPEEHRTQVLTILSDWALYVSQLSVVQRNELENGSYLSVLEPWLNGEIKQDIVVTSVRSKYFWILVDITYQGLSQEQIDSYVAGLQPRLGKLPPAVGCYTIVNNVPGPKHVKCGVPVVVLAFKPVVENPVDMPEPKLERKHSAQWGHMSESFAEKYPSTPLLLSPTTETFKTFVDNLVTPVAPTIVKKWLVVVCGTPPGGGKSTFFTALSKRESTKIVSSDVAKKTGKDFNQLLQKAFLDPKATVIGFDKNVPSASGLRAAIQKTIPLLKESNIDVHVVLVSPTTIDADKCWARIKQRGLSHIGLNTHEAGGEENARNVFNNVFLGQCTSLLKTLEGEDWEHIIRTNAFWEDESNLEPLLDRVWEAREAAPTATDVLISTDTLAITSTNPTAPSHGYVRYVGARITGTNLHLTIVPPNDEDLCKKYVNLAGRHIKVKFGSYYLASAPQSSTHGALRVGFWEIIGVSGIDESELYQPHIVKYHVTDSAGLAKVGPTRDTKPKHAADAMNQLKKLPSEIMWEIVKFENDFDNVCFEMDAVITLEK